MNLRWIAVAALAIATLTLAAGCGRVSLLSQPSPTSPPTRTPHPTFTPRPQETDTPIATDAPTETETAVPTETQVPPTRKVVPTARPKPPTQPPAPTPIPPTAGPTASPYKYSYVSQDCVHSGGTYIKVDVYSNYYDANSQQAGIKVRLSWAPDGPSIADVVTDGFGEATFVLAGDGKPAKVGTYYAWILGHDTRISDMSAPVVINGKNEDAPDTCWLAHVRFAAGK
jgi:hypothetical protein